MTKFIDHHILTIFSVCNASIELISTLPDTDTVSELRDLLEYQFDVIDCIIHERHYGSDALDSIIEMCQSILKQVKEFEEK